MKKILNWLGKDMEFEGNLSYAIASHKITNFPGEYIYEDELFNIATDPEIPIKGYMILAINKPIRSITDLTKDEREKLIDLSNRLLKTMHNCGFEKVMIYQDESSSGYLHINFIPRHEWINQFHANFGKMGIYAKKVLNVSDDYRQDLLNCIDKIKKNFK